MTKSNQELVLLNFYIYLDDACYCFESFIRVRRSRHMLRRGLFVIRRLGRWLFWAHPKLYRWIGRMRGRGDCADGDFDAWIGGYPRSANSFTTAALRLSNPTLRVATHRHIPPLIISAVRAKKPGILLIRQPKDAAVSWTIFWEGRWRLEEALDYYVDFHRALLPFRRELLVAGFDEVTQDVGGC